MAPSSGHLLVPKAIKVFKFAIAKASLLIRSKLPATSTAAAASLHPIPVRLARQPIHPIALFRQTRPRASSARWFGTLRSASARAPLPTSRVARTIACRGGAPFASTLRPNLTGGVLPRTAGGYSLGSGSRTGVRHFSHVPAAQAQVLHNVSVGMRAFILGGHKARFDGIDRRGAKTWRTISPAAEKAYEALGSATHTAARGSTLEFRLKPTVTALSPYPDNARSLHAPAVLPGLAVDFARFLTDLAGTLADLKRLARLGDLPASTAPDGSMVRVRFPGCDAASVWALCEELGVCRGTVVEDAAWQEDDEVRMALLFPFAPGPRSRDGRSEEELFEPMGHAGRDEVDWMAMLSDRTGDEADEASPVASANGRASDESLGSKGWEEAEAFESSASGGGAGPGEGYEGVEGIYRFLAECDGAGRW